MISPQAAPANAVDPENRPAPGAAASLTVLGIETSCDETAAAVVRLWTRFVPPIPSETWGEGLLDAQCLPLLLVACAAAAWSGQWHVSF